MTNVLEKTNFCWSASRLPGIPVIWTRFSASVNRHLSSCRGRLETGARALPAAALTLLLFGSFVLAGVTSGAQTVLAQEGCPITPGVTPPPDPAVTAQDVESGSATPGEFALAVRAQFKGQGSETVSGEQLAYAGCRLRLEGGPLRSGSTYIVTLTPDGRVFLHSKDMSLSARSLNPAIYGGILSALGVPRPVLAGLASPDPAIASRAQSALLQRLGREPHAAFDLTGAVPGVRPGIPGASGYAAAYVSANTEQPRLLLAGFDLAASHLREEVIDYGNPGTTAKDVVNRETLKQFVTEALRFLGEALRGAETTAESRAAFAKARLALRDPNGPWRHGSVYLYLLDRTSNIIVVHGAFPDRYELRPLVPTVRDVVTGKFVLLQVLEAASSSPEGGFVEYYFDDPTDDSDSADIPKLGYAREFTIAGLSARPQTFIIGSGVYLSSPNVVAARRNMVVKEWLARFGRTAGSHVSDAIESRLRGTPGTRVVLGGQPLALGGEFVAPVPAGESPDRGHLPADGLDPRTGEDAGRPWRALEMSELLLASSFDLASAEGMDPGSRWSVWGRGTRSSFKGADGALTLEGDVTTAVLGLDYERARWLVGVALARSAGEGTWRAGGDCEAGCSGKVESALTGVYPYARYRVSDKLAVWGALGHGQGDLTLKPGGMDSAGTDLEASMAAGGAKGVLLPARRAGGFEVSLRADLLVTTTRSDAAANLAQSEAETSRVRLALEASRAYAFGGGELTPSLEVGFRNDGGDAETGSGLEVGGALRYASGNLSAELRARGLIAHSAEDYEEWGVSGSVSYTVGSGGRGLSMRLGSALGADTGGAERLWAGASGLPGGNADPGARLDAEVSYGLDARRGLLTPYAGVALSQDAETWRAGARWNPGPAYEVSLEASLSETGAERPEGGVLLRGSRRW